MDGNPEPRLASNRNASQIALMSISKIMQLLNFVLNAREIFARPADGIAPYLTGEHETGMAHRNCSCSSFAADGVVVRENWGKTKNTNAHD